MVGSYYYPSPGHGDSISPIRLTLRWEVGWGYQASWFSLDLFRIWLWWIRIRLQRLRWWCGWSVPLIIRLLGSAAHEAKAHVFTGNHFSVHNNIMLTMQNNVYRIGGVSSQSYYRAGGIATRTMNIIVRRLSSTTGLVVI